jgi:hypothetical protein
MQLLTFGCVQMVNRGPHPKKRVPQGKNNPRVVNAALPADRHPEGI